MKNIYCASLSIPFSPDLEELSRVKQLNWDSTSWGQCLIRKHQQLDVFLSNFDLGLGWSELFYSPPGFNMPVHVDSNKYSNNCKINWIIGATGSVMNWWQTSSPDYTPTIHKTPVDSEYLLFDQDQCEIVWSDHLLHPSLINAGVPHNIDNCTDQGRWCMSYNIINVDDQKKKYDPTQWSDAIDKLKTIVMFGAVL